MPACDKCKVGVGASWQTAAVGRLRQGAGPHCVAPPSSSGNASLPSLSAEAAATAVGGVCQMCIDLSSLALANICGSAGAAGQWQQWPPGLPAHAQQHPPGRRASAGCDDDAAACSLTHLCHSLRRHFPKQRRTPAGFHATLFTVPLWPSNDSSRSPARQTAPGGGGGGGVGWRAGGAMQQRDGACPWAWPRPMMHLAALRGPNPPGFVPFLLLPTGQNIPAVQPTIPAS